jgi:hypothetical protein
MSTSAEQFPSNKSVTLLSRLLLGRDRQGNAPVEMRPELLTLSVHEFDDMVELANSNHVIVRALETFLEIVRGSGDGEREQWAEAALVAERKRIQNAIHFLKKICSKYEEHGYGITVIKSLDHLPDLGSDLDLFSDASPEDVCQLMKGQFGAELAPRSWGDRLACKWNFLIPGLPEAVEVHVGRLGQTGEQVAIASSLLHRTRMLTAGEHTLRITSASDRILLSTLQRMYRHFYFRLCDILDSTTLAESGGINYEDLRVSATRSGIWEGTATYLAIVSDYVKSYRGFGIDLPQFVIDAAKFGGRELYYSRGFLRVPIMPQSARLYTSQLAGTFTRGEIHNGARLSLLPWLATAAMLGQKLTGSDKGIW